MKFVNGVPLIEIIHEDELKDESALSQISLRAHYQERLHQFRADIALLFQKNRALNRSGSWMIFEGVDEANDEPGSLLTAPRVDVCVLYTTSEDQRNKSCGTNPYIRIIRNEIFTNSESLNCIVNDVVVDEGGDSIYAVGVANLGPGVETLSRSPVFCHRDGDVHIYSNGLEVTSYPHIQKVDNVIPFAGCANIEDRIQALEMASSLVLSVTAAFPIYSSEAD